MTSKKVSYTGVVLEGLLSPAVDKEGDVYVSSGYEVRRVMSDRTVAIVNTWPHEQFHFVFAGDGLWVYRDENGGRMSFRDVYETGKSHPDLPGVIWAPGQRNSTKLIGTAENPNGYELFVYDLTNESIRVIFGRFECASDGEHIYARERKKRFVCFDMSLEVVWSVPVPDPSYSKASQEPQFWRDTVLINHSREIRAYAKASGVHLWTYICSKAPGSFTVKNGRVYAEDAGNILVLDAEDGRVLVNEATGFRVVTDRSETANDTGVYPCGDLIYAISRFDPDVRFFSSDGKQCVQSLPLHPSGYGAYADYAPVIQNGVVYQKVKNQHAFVASGILVLRPAAPGEQQAICVAPRPPIRIFAVPSLDKPHSQRIFIEGDHLDDIRLYADVVIRELQFDTGHVPMYNLKTGPTDYQHDGVVELVVDVDPLGAEAKAVLETTLTDLQEHFDTQRAVSGNKHDPIKLRLICQSQSDWVFEGDPLDLAQARVSGKPLSPK